MFGDLIDGIAARVARADPVEVYIGIAVLAAVSAFSLWRLWRALHHARLIQDTPTAKARSVHQGYAELEGTGRLMDGAPIVAPLTQTPCVWYHYFIEERRTRYVRGHRSDQWVVVERGRSDSLFWLEDDTGRLAIDPDGAEVLVRHRDRWVGERESRKPLFKLFGLIPVTAAGQPRRYTEERIHPGEPVYAIGQIRNAKSHADLPSVEEDTRQLLIEWKKNQPALLERFDLDKNGKIDEREWLLARAQARREVLHSRQQSTVHAPEGINVLGKTGDLRKPYLLSAWSQHDLLRRYTWQAVLGAIGFLACGAAALWMFNIRMAGL